MNFAKTTVLLAEDDHLLRAALAHQLEQAGIGRVVVALDGQHALTQLRAQPVHAVACALDMPKLGGLQLAEQLRADPRHAALPILLMAGELDRAVVQQAVKVGINDMLVKPFSAKQLLDRLVKLLNRSEPAVSAAAGSGERLTLLVVDDTPENLQLMAETKTMGMCRDWACACRRRATSKPSMPGIMMSSRMRSGGSGPVARARAFSPFGASFTR
jgi:CheY-like chemotaxis protein